MDRPYVEGRPHDDSDIGGSHSRGDHDDQGRFGRRIEMSVVDRFLRVRFGVSPQGRIAGGLWGRDKIWSTEDFTYFYVLENGDHRVKRHDKLGRSCKKEDWIVWGVYGLWDEVL